MCGPLVAARVHAISQFFSYKNEGKRSHLKRIFRRKNVPGEKESQTPLAESMSGISHYILWLLCTRVPFFCRAVFVLKNNVKASDSRAHSRDTHCTFTVYSAAFLLRLCCYTTLLAHDKNIKHCNLLHRHSVPSISKDAFLTRFATMLCKIAHI